MQLSLRTRLTVWYSVLLVLTVGIFTATILWLHWRLLLDEFDDGLKSISATANNVVEEELGESKDLGSAAAEMAKVVRAPDGVVLVLDASGAPILAAAQRMPLPPEIRSPGFTRTTQTVTGADGRPWRVTVAQQASRLTRLVDDMLVLARADGGGYPIVMASVDLSALVSECVREIGAPADERQITIRASLEPVTVNGDEGLLRRMLSNLLANAVTYTARGGSVDVSLAKGTDGVILRVADTGPGIPAEDRERVFERFVRLDPARAAGGAGLGLAIVRWVAAHGGDVRIVSSGPAGSVFAANLPT